VIADSAEPIAMERAAAREQIWTPDKGEQERDGEKSTEGSAGEKSGELWTPGS
jgi:hypothetical protein